MRTFLCCALAVVLSATSLAQGGGGGGAGLQTYKFIIENRKAIPGTIIRVRVQVVTSEPIRGIDFSLAYSSDSLAARESFYLNWGAFPNWLYAQYTIPDTDHVVMAGRYPFMGSATLGWIRERLANYVLPGTTVKHPTPRVFFNDTTRPELYIGFVTAGNYGRPGDVNGDDTLTVGDAVRGLDIAIPDTGAIFLEDVILRADASGDGGVDMWDCWQILARIVYPWFRLDVEDTRYYTEKPIPIGGVGKAHIVAEETAQGVMIKTADGSSLVTADLTIRGVSSFSLESQLPLQQMFSKVVRKSEREARLGFVKLEPIAGNVNLVFIPGARVDQIEITGKVNEGIPLVVMKIGRTTSVEDRSIAPTEFALAQNYPNPFNPATTIAFTLPTASYATLTVYNVLGEEVARVMEGERSAGTHTVHFDASAFPSGMYVYRLQANGTMLSKKMLLTK